VAIADVLYRIRNKISGRQKETCRSFSPEALEMLAKYKASALEIQKAALSAGKSSVEYLKDKGASEEAIQTYHNLMLIEIRDGKAYKKMPAIESELKNNKATGQEAMVNANEKLISGEDMTVYIKKWIICAYLAAVSIASLYVPYVSVVPNAWNGSYFNIDAGYHFIFAKHDVFKSIAYGRVGLAILGITAIAGCLYVFVDLKKRH